MRQLGIVALLVCIVTIRGLAFGGVEVQGNKVVAETEKGRVVVDRGVVTEMMNRVTGETYTVGQAKPDLTALLWYNAPAQVDSDAKLTCEKRGPNEALISAALADGHQLKMTVGVDPATQDVLIRQSGSSKKKGLYGVQWGIAGLDPGRVRTLVPGNSGVCLDQRCPASEMSFGWPSGWEVQMMVAETGAGGFSVWTEDTEMRFKTLKWGRARGEVTLAFSSQNFAPFDDLTSVESVEWRLAFFKGDWRVPAKRPRKLCGSSLSLPPASATSYEPR